MAPSADPRRLGVLKAITDLNFTRLHSELLAHPDKMSAAAPTYSLDLGSPHARCVKLRGHPSAFGIATTIFNPRWGRFHPGWDGRVSFSILIFDKIHIKDRPKWQ